MEVELQENLRTYLVNRHRTELTHIVANSDCTQNYSITVNFITLFENNIKIGNGLLIEPNRYLSALNDAAISAQKYILHECNQSAKTEEYRVKPKVTVRVENLPVFGETTFPCNKDIGFFVRINGTLIKAGPPKLLEHQRDYICMKCHHVTTMKATYEKCYLIIAPSKCDECRSSNIKPKKEMDVLNFLDYQEVKVQEHFGKSKVGTIPKSILVTLEGDLVDSCKPGDDVIITGVLSRRWRPVKPGVKYDIDLVVNANNLEVCREQKSSISNKQLKESFKTFWDSHRQQELIGRDHILQSFCPQIYGLHLAKLAMVTVLAGGVQKTDDNGCSARGMSHLLLVGDAGTGKSHLLRYAARISNHSVFTTGVGSTTAGLTVTAIRESGDWNLEAGALVLADGGLCCIDDFNSIREHDRTSIHEAMEQQSISVAKAGMVTKLHTRCSIFATTSTKDKYDCSMPMSVNVAISSPLLSRFDIVLVLLDSKCPNWDRSLCHFMFDDRTNVCDTQEQSPTEGDSLLKSTWSTTDIQNYFAIIRELNPVMTAEAGAVLRAYYQFQRMADSRNAARTTVRLLESLIRLSQGHARLMFREKVTVLDAVTAITLIEASMLNDAFGSQVNALHTVASDTPYEEYKSQAEQILTKLKLSSILRDELQKIQTVKFSNSQERDETVLNGPNLTSPKSEVSVSTIDESLHGRSPRWESTKILDQISDSFARNENGGEGAKESDLSKKKETRPFADVVPAPTSAWKKLKLEDFSLDVMEPNDRSGADEELSGPLENLTEFESKILSLRNEAEDLDQQNVTQAEEEKPRRKRDNPFSSAEDDWTCLDF